MVPLLENSLYEKQKENYKDIVKCAKEFCAIYCGRTILRDNIFNVIFNYAKKNNIDLELLRFPFSDNELWAFTYLKKGTIFVCNNSELELCKQLFAAAHELYHIYCYVEDVDQHIISEGSILESETVDDMADKQEDIEANAFAAYVLMPQETLNEQIDIYEISKDDIDINEVLMLMDMFAMPFKATVLRLYECDIISNKTAEYLLGVENEEIIQKIELTGCAKRWQLSGKGMESLGSLVENLEFDIENELLVDSREKSDKIRLQEIKKKLGLE